MKKLLIVAMMLLYTGATWAKGTQAGTNIDNNGTLSFVAGGVTQNAVNSNVDTFVVDRKIDFTLTNDDGDQKEVVPGAQDRNTTWTLTNTGNADQNFTLVSGNLAAGKKIYNDADTNNTTGQTIYYDNHDGNGWRSYSSGNILIPIDNNISIHVGSDFSLDLQDGNIINIKLTAKAVDKNGDKEEATSDADNKNSVDTVLAEQDHTSDKGDESNTNYNAETTRFGGYKVVVAKLTMTKTSCVYSDPINGTSNPKRIPGAKILYLFTIDNNGSANAHDITITDTLDSNLDGETLVTSTDDDANKTTVTESTSDCSCSDGTKLSGNEEVDDTNTDPQIVKVEDLNVSSGTKTCVSFIVEIK